MSGIDFYVAQKVVCVLDFAQTNPQDTAWYERVSNFPVVGQVYTIRHIAEYPMTTGNPVVGIRLEEIINPSAEFSIGKVEPAFNLKHFKPVYKTDISIFTAMLNTKSLELIK